MTAEEPQPPERPSAGGEGSPLSNVPRRQGRRGPVPRPNRPDTTEVYDQETDSSTFADFLAELGLLPSRPEEPTTAEDDTPQPADDVGGSGELHDGAAPEPGDTQGAAESASAPPLPTREPDGTYQRPLENGESEPPARGGPSPHASSVPSPPRDGGPEAHGPGSNGETSPPATPTAPTDPPTGRVNAPAAQDTPYSEPVGRPAPPHEPAPPAGATGTPVTEQPVPRSVPDSESFAPPDQPAPTETGPHPAQPHEPRTTPPADTTSTPLTEHTDEQPDLRSAPHSSPSAPPDQPPPAENHARPSEPPTGTPLPRQTTEQPDSQPAPNADSSAPPDQPPPAQTDAHPAPPHKLRTTPPADTTGAASPEQAAEQADPQPTRGPLTATDRTTRTDTDAHPEPLSATDDPAATQPPAPETPTHRKQPTAPSPRTTTEPTGTRPPVPSAPETPTERPNRAETPHEPAGPEDHRHLTAPSLPSQRPQHQAELTPSTPRRRDTGSGGEQVLDLVCVGGGPFSLSLSALADSVPGLRTACFERERAFRWHPGLLIEGATLQVPFLADLVTLADPASPWSFLRFLRDRRRLFPFYLAERFHIERTEYDAYCRWVSDGLAERAAGSPGTGPHYGHHVDAVRWSPRRALFEVDFTRLDTGGGTGSPGRAAARNVALGIGTEPYVPEALRPLAESGSVPVVHSAEYLDHRERLLAAEHVTVVGSGQSGAEVFLDLLRRRPAGHEGLHWLTRSPAFAPMEYSKLGLEHFTPDYTRYFHSLPEEARDSLLPKQWQLHKAVDAETLAAVHEELYRRAAGGSWPDVVLTPGVGVRTAGRLGATHLELHLVHAEQRERGRLLTDAVVLATGYRERPSDGLLAALDPHLSRDSSGRPLVTGDYRLRLDTSVAGSVYVQNGERHTHGVGAPDLGLAAHRSAVILNSLTGEEHFPLPARTAFTSFGLREPDPGTPSTRAPGRLGDVRPMPEPSAG